MSRGVSNKITAAKDLNPLYRGTLNAFCAISDAALDQDNKALSTQAAANTLIATGSIGLLAGSVVAIVDAATVGAALADTGVLAGIVGIAVRNSAGDHFESTSSYGSGGITYLHGTNTLVEVAVFETVAFDATTPLTYAAGENLYASQNGLLTNAAGLEGGAAAAGATVVAIVIDPPTTSNPVMTVQLRV